MKWTSWRLHLWRLNTDNSSNNSSNNRNNSRRSKSCRGWVCRAAVNRTKPNQTKTKQKTIKWIHRLLNAASKRRFRTMGAPDVAGFFWRLSSIWGCHCWCQPDGPAASPLSGVAMFRLMMPRRTSSTWWSRSSRLRWSGQPSGNVYTAFRSTFPTFCFSAASKLPDYVGQRHAAILLLLLSSRWTFKSSCHTVTLSQYSSILSCVIIGFIWNVNSLYFHANKKRKEKKRKKRRRKENRGFLLLFFSSLFFSLPVWLTVTRS